MGSGMKRHNRNRRHRRGKTSLPTIETELAITDVGHRGDGVAILDGQKIFVAKVLPGERVAARVSGNRGEVIEVIEPSADRINPSCDHFSDCGGCALQHVRDDVYKNWKRRLVVSALRRNALETAVDDLIDAHGEGRRRVTLHARFAKNRIRVGFMRARSRDLMDLDHCPVLAPELSDAATIAATAGLSFCGPGKPLDIQLTATDTGLDCNMEAAGEMTYELQVGLAESAEVFDLARVSLAGDVVVERRQPVISMGAAKISPPAGGFLQATAAGEAAIAGLVVEHAGQSKSIADLFCGVGPFALRLASERSVFAADADAEAIAALDQAVRFTANLKPVTTRVRNLFSDPLLASELAPFDAVIFDPPRAGAEAQALELAASTVATVVAVSCDPATFARDAAILTAGGYVLERVTPVDQFKYSAHVEIVGVFRR